MMRTHAPRGAFRRSELYPKSHKEELHLCHLPYEGSARLSELLWQVRLEGLEPSVPRWSQPSQDCVYAIPP